MSASTADDWVSVQKHGKGWARVIMAREPVNSMNHAFWQRLSEVLRACEQDPDVRGIIFCSGLKKSVFSAGNDLAELYAPGTTRERYKRFWKASNSFLCDLYVSPLLTVSAIRGACPAGGCCLSLCCDYRIAADNARMGLNEVALGIPVPKYWALLMARWTGHGVSDRLCTFAQMSSADQALGVGMVDEVVTPSQLCQAAETAMAAMLRLPDVGRIATKQQTRGEFAAEWRGYLEHESELGFTQLQQPETVEALGAVIRRLSGGARSRL